MDAMIMIRELNIYLKTRFKVALAYLAVLNGLPRQRCRIRKHENKHYRIVGTLIPIL